MKKIKRLMIVSCSTLLAASSVLGLVACGEGGGGRGSGGKYTTIEFWGGGDANETEVFGDLVKTFNETIGAEKKIKVNYSGGNDDYDNIATTLSSPDTPDVVYVPDRQFKNWASSGYLAPLTNPTTGEALYEGLDEFTAPGKLWDQGINRYRFDLDTLTTTNTSTLWALPKDIGPTVLYYNREYLEYLGIEHISMTAEEAKAAGYPEKGYFQKGEKWYFNNKVPMSWDEVTALGMRLQKEIKKVNINGTNFTCDYGYFTEWWFNYAWSIGGNCVEYVAEEPVDGKPMGYYEFTLDDRTPNWIVKDDFEGTLTVNGTAYTKGQIISYTDKTAGSDKSWQSSCNKLPSMYDAFLEFVALTCPEGADVGTMTDGTTKVLGKHVSMGQTSIGSQSARDRFSAGSIGMYVGLRADVTHLRKKIGERNGWMKDQDSWDVAPLPMYKLYDEDGNITLHGVQAGHSGSMGLAIAYRSKKKEAAWELVKYIAGVEGQTAQAEAGFCIPNQIDVAQSDVFLQPTMAPKNAQAFVDAAAYEQPADWWYLTDWHWIDNWSTCLNQEVRENKKSVSQLFDEWGSKTQTALYKYTYSSYNPRPAN